MNTWVITGGVACGKSLFCQILIKSIERVRVFDSDACVHQLLTRASIVRKIEAAFGGGIVGGNGEIIRPELRNLVFSDAASRRKLERIVHPEVFGELRQSIHSAEAAGDTELFVADIPLYFETMPPDLKSDQVLVVAASRDVQVQRIVARSEGRIDPLIARTIVDAQLPVRLKADRADRVIWNDGNRQSFSRQVMRVLRANITP